MKRLRTPLLLAALAFGGIVGGHALSYAFVAPDPHVHESLLAHTGHRYFSLLVVPAVASFVAAAVLLTSRSQPGGRAKRSWLRTAVALSILQVGGFTLMEAGERFFFGAGLGTLFEGSTVLVGLCVQVAVALVGAALLAALRRGREAVRASSPGRLGEPSSSVTVLLPAIYVPRLRPATGGASLRAPPPA